MLVNIILKEKSPTVTSTLAYYEFITTVNKYKIERLARDERSSLFVPFVGDGENRFMTSTPGLRLGSDIVGNFL